ncbi:MAG TPA: cell division protein ZapD [Burkholderiales bacterium]|nr:cell division protein ZapD [Burkholderiales bacterium]
MISYEYPLNERIRTLLRLEDLFDRALYFAAKPEPLDHHVSLISLFEILEVAGRADLKSDLLQELERQRQSLDSLRGNPAIAEEVLTEVLRGIDTTSRGLLDMSGKIGQHLRANEWLMAIKQRTTIPGGVCEFDLPSYHYWLNLDGAVRRHSLMEWITPLLPIRDGIAIVLRLLRESGKTTRQVAYQGVYQQMMAGRVAQMVRLRFSRDLPCVPEISANKYALNIRFIAFSSTERPRVCEGDTEFELTFCNL